MSPGVSALFQICFAASNNMKEGFWQKTERTVRGLAQVPFFSGFSVWQGPKFVYLWKILVKEM